MYLRYFNWNFIGRESDIQDASWYSGLTESRHHENPANSYYFFFPLILGLIGMIYHFQKDWKRGLSVLALFFLTGLAIIFYLNQTPFEPRERDYAYAGSFFAFSIWIGIGATAVTELVKKAVSDNKALSYGVMALMIAAVPIWMGYQNYPGNDRSDRYVARDYAYNLLNSVEKNALLFTNGDNDTFPLWYIQEVEGVRTDVRVVNLMLLNTDWHIAQSMRKAYESDRLPISLPYKKYREGSNDVIYINEKTNKYYDIEEIIKFIKSNNPQTQLRTQRGERVDYIPTRNFILPVDSASIVDNNVVDKEDAGQIGR